MTAADQLSSLPALHERVNSLVCTLHDAACMLGVRCAVAEILVVTGWGVTIVAAEEWFDPATLLWHPMMVDRPIPALAHVQAEGLARLKALGLMCRDAWFHQTDTDALIDFVMEHRSDQHIVVLWGVNEPGYAIIHNATATHLTSYVTQQTITYDAINARGGIHCIVVSRLQHNAQIGYIQYLQAALSYTNRIEFASPNHPLRTMQTWHIGVGAWDVLAYVAHQAAPLSLVSTHVAKVVHDYAWRLAHVQAFFSQLQDDSISSAQRMRLVGAIDDCCFYIGILHKQYAHLQHHSALTTADGELIAQVCGEIATTMRDVKRILEVH